MNKLSGWFKDLSRIGQVSLVSVLSMGGMFTVSAAFPPQTNTSTQPPVSASVEKKEPVITTSVQTETQSIAFQKKTVEDGRMAIGVTSVRVNGVEGLKTFMHTITFSDGKEIDRKTTETITNEPVDEVTAIGTYIKPTSVCDTNYSGCVPIVSYDLDCNDIGRSVVVLGYDKHGFDRDNDGYGCESY
jgi:hypothetical protein